MSREQRHERGAIVDAEMLLDAAQMRVRGRLADAEPRPLGGGADGARAERPSCRGLSEAEWRLALRSRPVLSDPLSSAIADEANAREPREHHHPGRGLGND
jgi:hypothetical protein